MYIVGHMVWGYVAATIVQKSTKKSISLPLVLMVSIIPDIDLVVEDFGLEYFHRTLTHSLVLWIPVFLVLFMIWRSSLLSYAAAVLQHFLLGDYVVDSVAILWPLSNLHIGLSYELGSALDVIIESLGMLLFSTIFMLKGELKNIFSLSRANLLYLLPWLVIITFLTSPIILGIGIAISQEAVLVAHLLLLGLLTIPVIQGSRASASNIRPKRKL